MLHAYSKLDIYSKNLKDSTSLLHIIVIIVIISSYDLCIWYPIYYYIHGLVQERCNSGALAMELRLSCTNPSIYGFVWNTLTQFSLFAGMFSESHHVEVWYTFPLAFPYHNISQDMEINTPVKTCHLLTNQYWSALVLSGNKPLSEPLMTNISVTIWCH